MIFRDVYGHTVAHDGVSPVTWRLTVYVLAQHDGKILMTEPAYAARQELPGGEVEIEETLLEGARREVWEETGYHLASIGAAPLHFEEMFFYESHTRRYRHTIVAIFAGQVAGPADPAWQPLPDEVKRVAWIDPADLAAKTTPAHQWAALVKAGLVAAQPAS